MTTTPHLLTFPAPDQLLWICPVCGPAENTRIAPSQVFRRSGSSELGNSEWRKIQCEGCERKFMLRIDSDGGVRGRAITAAGEEKTAETVYSAVDDENGHWLNG